jgi:hypothetical protein
LINFRDDIEASSPLAHTVNVEFDGASAKFGTEELIGWMDRISNFAQDEGMSNAEPRFAGTPYRGKDSTKTNDVDMVGIISRPLR